MTAPAEAVLRPLRESDAERMARLHVAGWRNAAASSLAATTVAEHDGDLVGFVSVGPGRDEDLDLEVELWALYACAAWWGRGLGHRMLTHALAARASYLWVLDGNERATGFYRRQGFVADGTERHEPEGRELRMVRR
ncbi:GNAT family N-acetyltransferase [Pimelobacter sp. 30-1]|uniref:GNAT family N-acetyltransferase n=1 Tax=Pimelobacter sp. 30-1 TaxID=2004991 RepID=UPI001C0597A4|nr:GNAT family N-acetyltransferase [Pimelobacter sp. 30-1]MBU2695679.1 hypothetical protein [Pimelobacter sp. 30-1]